MPTKIIENRVIREADEDFDFTRKPVRVEMVFRTYQKVKPVDLKMVTKDSLSKLIKAMKIKVNDVSPKDDAYKELEVIVDGFVTSLRQSESSTEKEITNTLSASIEKLIGNEVEWVLKYAKVK